MGFENDLIDMGNWPEIYADGVADALFLGANLRLVMFSWRKIDGVIRRVVAAHLIRPLASVPPEVLPVWEKLGGETRRLAN